MSSLSIFIIVYGKDIILIISYLIKKGSASSGVQESGDRRVQRDHEAETGVLVAGRVGEGQCGLLSHQESQGERAPRALFQPILTIFIYFPSVFIIPSCLEEISSQEVFEDEHLKASLGTRLRDFTV